MIWNRNFSKLCRTDVNQLFQMNETHNLLIYLAVWESSSFIITSVCSWTMYSNFSTFELYTIRKKFKNKASFLKNILDTTADIIVPQQGEMGYTMTKSYILIFPAYTIQGLDQTIIQLFQSFLYTVENVVFKSKRSHYLFTLIKYTRKRKVCYWGQVSLQCYCAYSIY